LLPPLPFSPSPPSAKLFSNQPLAFGRQLYYCSLTENDRSGIPPRLEISNRPAS
jgi:hypothetical protein